MNLARQARTTTSRHLEDLLSRDTEDIGEAFENLRQLIVNAASSRRAKYSTLNPTLSVHPVYTQRRSSPSEERHRLSFTRFRVSAHSLAIETGRWNRGGRGRLPVEERLCTCGGVQDELHVVEACPRTEHIRQEYRFLSYRQLIEETRENTLMEIIFKILQVYD